eukprot:XP_001703711.1 predicted protein [Chlamydomonas reinhardtii]
MKTKVLVVPVYQKHWLWFTFSEATAAEAAAERAVHWTQGGSLPEKAQLLGKEISYKFNAATQKQWKAMQAAEEGSFRNRLYKLARWVLSQEDPTETFLKQLPRQPGELEVIHPASVKERLVRRRMRRMAQAQEAFHNRRILGWALATIPQLPLVLTPLPNVTLYYTAYKMVSHYQAVQGFDRFPVLFLSTQPCSTPLRWETPLDDDRAAQLRDIFAPPAGPKTKTATTTATSKQQQQGKGEAPQQQEGAGDADSGLGPEALPELVARLRRKVLEGAAAGAQGKKRAPGPPTLRQTPEAAALRVPPTGRTPGAPFPAAQRSETAAGQQQRTAELCTPPAPTRPVGSSPARRTRQPDPRVPYSPDPLLAASCAAAWWSTKYNARSCSALT